MNIADALAKPGAAPPDAADKSFSEGFWEPA
jgi:hypothetical protein